MTSSWFFLSTLNYLTIQWVVCIVTKSFIVPYCFAVPHLLWRNSGGEMQGVVYVWVCCLTIRLVFQTPQWILYSNTDGSSIFDAISFKGHICKLFHSTEEKGYEFQRDLYYQYKIFSLLILSELSLFEDYKEENSKVTVLGFIPESCSTRILSFSGFHWVSLNIIQFLYRLSGVNA